MRRYGEGAVESSEREQHSYLVVHTATRTVRMYEVNKE